MRIVLNGRRVGNGDIAVYFQNRAYFTKRGLNKRTVLHELYITSFMLMVWKCLRELKKKLLAVMQKIF